MNALYPFPPQTDRIVYVKPVAVADLPQDVQDQVEGREVIFAVHDADGQQIALVADRQMAYLLAREHDFAPVAIQ